MKPKLTVLLAAGGSVEVGLPSTDDLLRVATRAIQTSPASVSDEWPFDLEQAASAIIKRCAAYFGPRFNFEHLMHALEALDTTVWNLRCDWPTTDKPVEPMLAAGPHEDIAPSLDPLFARAAQASLLFSVHREVSEATTRAPGHEKWPGYVKFWRSLWAEFDLTIGTLNYDTLVEQALGLGASDQGFEPIEGENTWRFDEHTLRKNPTLMHLHGSIHFGYREYGTDANRFWPEDNWDDLYWHPTPESAASSAGSGRSDGHSQARRKNMKGPLITGLDKSDKLLVDPYGAYVRMFADRLVQCPRLLIVGYGFGDYHVNALLSRMGKLHKGRQRIAAITKFDPVEMHGSWGPARGEEVGILRKLGQDPRLLEQMHYTNPMTAKTGRVRVYYDGLADVSTNHLDSLTGFLLS